MPYAHRVENAAAASRAMLRRDYFANISHITDMSRSHGLSATRVSRAAKAVQKRSVQKVRCKRFQAAATAGRLTIILSEVVRQH